MNAMVGMFREQFKRMALPLFVVFAVFSCVALMCYGYENFASPAETSFGNEMGEVLAYFTYALVLISTGVALMFGYSDTDRLLPLVPTYATRLPMGTLKIVLSRMTFNLLAMAAMIALCNVELRFLFAEAELSTDDLIAQLCVFLFIHSMVWFTAGYSKLAVVMCTAILPPLGLIVLTRMFSFSLPEPLTFLLVGLPLGFLVAYRGVYRQRHGIEAPYLFREGILDDMLAVGPPEGGFESPYAAQRWYEWRRTGYMLPGGALCLAVLFAFLLWFELTMSFRTINESVPGTLETTVSPTALLGYFAVMIAISGVMLSAFASAAGGFSLNYRDYLSRSNNFVFVRPVSTRELAAARTNTVVRSLGWGAGIVVAGALITVLSAPFLEPGNRELYAPDGSFPVLMLAASPFLMLGFLAMGWCVSWVGTIFLGFILLAVVSSGQGVLQFFHVNPFGPALDVMLIAIGLVLTVAVAAALRRALGEGILRKSHVTIGVILTPLVFIAGFALQNMSFLTEPEGQLFIEDVPILVAMVPLFLVPLAVNSFVLRWARHR